MKKEIGIGYALVCASFLPAQSPLLPQVQQTALGTPNADVHIGDYDADGIVDFAVGGDLYLGDGSGTFRPTTIRGSGSWPGGIQHGPVGIADIDADGDLDIVYPDGLWMHQAGAYTDETTARIGTTLSAGARIALVYDADNDGDTDMLAVFVQGTSYKSMTLQIALNDGTGNFPTAISRYLGAGSSVLLRGIVNGDFNGDGTQDIAFSFTWADIGYGGTFGGVWPSSSPPWLQGSHVMRFDQIVGAADFNGDGLDDVVSCSSFGATAWLGGRTAAPLAVGGSGHGYVADFDGDGDQDVLTRSATTTDWQLSVNDGAANFVSTSLSVPGAPWGRRQVGLGDLDGDGDADVLLSSTPRVLYNARGQLQAPSSVSQPGTLTLTAHAVDEAGPLGGLAILGLSFAPADVPIPGLGVLRIDLAQHTVLPAATLTAGQATASFAIPGVPALVGVELFGQAVIADSSNRVRLSNRVRTTIL